MLYQQASGNWVSFWIPLYCLSFAACLFWVFYRSGAGEMQKLYNGVDSFRHWVDCLLCPFSPLLIIVDQGTAEGAEASDIAAQGPTHGVPTGRRGKRSPHRAPLVTHGWNVAGVEGVQGQPHGPTGTVRGTQGRGERRHGLFR